MGPPRHWSPAAPPPHLTWTPWPLLLTSGGQDWKHFQICSFTDPPQPLLLTSDGYWSKYSQQTGVMHHTGMFSCIPYCDQMLWRGFLDRKLNLSLWGSGASQPVKPFHLLMFHNRHNLSFFRSMQSYRILKAACKDNLWCNRVLLQHGKRCEWCYERWMWPQWGNLSRILRNISQGSGHQGALHEKETGNIWRKV